MGADKSKSDRPLIWILEPLVPTGLLPAPEWFIEDMMPENCLGALYGQPSSFKTWTATAKTMCLGTGLPFCSKRTKRSKVLYIAADDAERPQQRAQAWVKYYEPVLKEQEIDPFENVMILKKAINLHTDDLSWVVENIRRQGFKPDVIVFDTLFHSSIGADLMKPEHMLTIADRARKLMADPDLSLGARYIELIHHTPKEGKTLFGTQALLASTDVLWRLEETGPNQATLTCDRMRGARKFDPFELTFQSINMRMAPNSWGQEWVEQLVLAGDVKPAAKAKTKEDEDLEDMEMNLECFLGNKATFTDWLEQMWHYYKVKRDDKDKKGWSKRSFTRKLDILKNTGRVAGGGKQGDLYSVAHTEEARRARHGDTTAAPKPTSPEPVPPKPVPGVIPRGDDTCGIGFDGGQAAPNRCHDASGTASRSSGKEAKPVVPSDQNDVLATIGAAMQQVKKANGER